MEKIIRNSDFLTATIVGWKQLLKPEKYKNIVLKELQSLVIENVIILYAYCIMNNHIHIIWQIKGDHNSSEVKKLFLEHTAKAIKQDLSIHHPNVLNLFASTQKDRAFHFWKRRSLAIELYSEHVFDQKLNYIHENPVKAGLCSLPEEYSFSSAAFYYSGKDEWNMLSHVYA